MKDLAAAFAKSFLFTDADTETRMKAAEQFEAEAIANLAVFASDVSLGRW
jgi:hypothetical protein